MYIFFEAPQNIYLFITALVFQQRPSLTTTYVLEYLLFNNLFLGT